ncbi:hypothetical protein SDC9_155519 [bioreactor metagenome]|uniref:Uncharacterized protein n=1 Tax=bioreactor metagenome TaxID=1076179 RepID=A0A645F1Z9_9ZZZZ
MIGPSVHADHDAGMLHMPVRIDQLRANRARITPLRKLLHRFDPISAEHFHIVI